MPILKVYIVEDEPLIAASLKHMLLNMGHIVCGIAESYDDAVNYLDKFKVDLVITDIMLKGEGTGIDLGRYIKTHFNLPVIYQSSVNDEQMIKEAMGTGPIAYLKKPVSKDALSSAIAVFRP